MPSKKATTPKSATKATKRATKATERPAVKKQAAESPVKSAASTAKKRVPKKQPATASSEAAASTTPPSWLTAARAADSKKATNLHVLDLREITSFADFFLICSGSNQRQIQAIANDIETELKKQGERPTSVEGYGNAEWVLMDYGDLVVHVFSDQARAYYDLDRLWRDGKEVPVTL